MTEIEDKTKGFLEKYLYGRFSNPFYVNLIFFSVFFHFDLFITLFFTNEKSILITTGLLKDQYITHKYFYTYSFWLKESLALIFTFLNIWSFPKLFLNKAYEEELMNEHSKNISKQEKEIYLAKKRVILEESKAEEKIQIKRQTEADPTIQWDIDYLKMKERGYITKFINLVNYYYNGNNSFHSFNADELSYFVGLGLLKVANREILGLTPKGDYFLVTTKENKLVDKTYE